jgi:hypothetical protein
MSEAKRDPIVMATLVLLAIISPLGLIYCLLGLAGGQSSPVAGGSNLLLPTAWFGTSALSVFAMLRGRRWGAYLLGSATLLITLIDIASGTATWGGASLGLVIAVMIMAYLRSNGDSAD